jgi:threonyl-tRNA synthetase
MLGSSVKHFKMSRDPRFLAHPIYSKEELLSVEVTHRSPRTLSDKIALNVLRSVRWTFDLVTGYHRGLTSEKVLNRITFLETAAAVPPFVAAMVRHIKSVGGMKRDKGWTHTLLEEAENERMHLLTILEYRQKPSLFFRSCVLVTQGVLFNGYFLWYLLAPSQCHRFVGCLEEEAVITYTHILEEMDAGKLPDLAEMKASKLAQTYWQLPVDATFRDVILALRADEMVHREVNHELADTPQDAQSPFGVKVQVLNDLKEKAEKMSQQSTATTAS